MREYVPMELRRFYAEAVMAFPSTVSFDSWWEKMPEPTRLALLRAESSPEPEERPVALLICECDERLSASERQEIADLARAYGLDLQQSASAFSPVCLRLTNGRAVFLSRLQ